ncbi:MAG: hypothetical protein V1778_01250 [bacterium]
MPEWMLVTFRRALEAEAFREKAGQPGEAFAAYRAHVERWIAGGAELDLSLLEKVGARDILTTVWMPPQFTIADIELDLPRYTNVRVIPTEVEARWSHYPSAFAIFWALIYHVENAYLAHPDVMWRELMRIYSYVNPYGRNSFTMFRLALLERTLGMEYDEHQQLRHYVKNISERSELEPHERQERIRLFHDAVAHMKQRIIESLLQ